MSPFRMRQKLRSLPFRVSGKEHVTKKLYDSVRTPCIQVSHEKKIVYGGIVRRMSPFRMREKLRSLPFRVSRKYHVTQKVIRQRQNTVHSRLSRKKLFREELSAGCRHFACVRS